MPNCVSYDPTFAYEVAVIIQDGLRRMCAEQEDVYYYITVMNENYTHPAMPEGAVADILKEMYHLREGPKSKGPRVQLMGSGVIPAAAIAAAELLKNDWGVDSDIWSCPSFTELARDGMAVTRWNTLHPTDTPRRSHVETCLEGTTGPAVAATDYMRLFAEQIRPLVPRRYVVLGTDGFGRSDAREAASLLRGQPAVRRRRRVEGARGRRCDTDCEGRRSDREVRPRPRKAGAVDGLMDVKVPDVGDFKDMPVIEVLVKAGDTVTADDALVTLESDKATMDVPAPAAGVIKEVKIKAGDKVSEGTLVLTLEQRKRKGAAATGARARTHGTSAAARAAAPAPSKVPSGACGPACNRPSTPPRSPPRTPRLPCANSRASSAPISRRSTEPGRTAASPRMTCRRT